MNDEKMTIRLPKETKDKLYAIQYKSFTEGKKKSFGQIITELLENKDYRSNGCDHRAKKE